ncbi:MAG: peptidase [Verrucomicrobiales bacterium]|nr:peptidase [Verrucomicrobiales bacterium]
MNRITLFSLLLANATLLFADDAPDLQIVHRIKAEAFENSHVMDHLFYLTDVNGPRLTGSPGFESAAQWALGELQKSGAENAHLEKWGPFGRGWSYSTFSISLQKPTFAPLHGTPLAWSEGTQGAVRGPVAATALYHEDEGRRDIDIETIRERIAEYEKEWKGKLRGKIVLLGRERAFSQPTDSASKREDDKALAALTEYSELAPSLKPAWIPDKLPRDGKKRAAMFKNLPLDMTADYWERTREALDTLNVFFREEGALAILKTDSRGSGGVVFSEAAGPYKEGEPVAPASVALAPEHFNRLWRLVEKNIATEVEINLAAAFVDKPVIANVIAEIPGGKKKDEVVMLGGHLDSWHAGTGATDNAAGCAVALEAMRILKVLGLKMDRTVRVALWSGEEQGIWGSRAYVREHFADPSDMRIKPEHTRLAAYFNLDNGSGKIRGIHLQGNDMARPIFESWFHPFKDLGAGTITIRDTGGTDHLSFDQVGLPGFQFIQDPLDYMSRTHHSELDVYDHVEPGDLMQASAIMASFVYNAAMREQPIPRKPLPDPLPPRLPVH